MHSRMILNYSSLYVYCLRTGVHHHAGITGMYCHVGIIGLYSHAGVAGMNLHAGITGVNLHAGILALLVTTLRTSCMLDKPSAIPTCSFFCFWHPDILKILSLTTQIQVPETIGVPDFGIFLLHSHTYKHTVRFVIMWVNIMLVP